MKKVMIFGRPGSGKSTFSVHLSQYLNLPVHHLDKQFYIENWVERNHNEFLKIQQNLVEQDAWIIDGNAIRSLEIRWSHADLVLYFNFPKFICYFRILKRYFRPNRTFDDRAPGCYEKISLSLLKYIWSFEQRVSDMVNTLKERYPHSVFYEIRNIDDLNKLKFDLQNQSL